MGGRSCDSLAADAAVRSDSSVSRQQKRITRCDKPAASTQEPAIDWFVGSICVQLSLDWSLASATADFHGRNMLRRGCLFIRIICNQSGHRRQSMRIINQRRARRLCENDNLHQQRMRTLCIERWGDSVVCWFAALNLLVQKCMGTVCRQGNLVQS